jgi:hypothetical protein
VLSGIAVGAILTFMVRIKKQRKTKIAGQTPSGPNPSTKP